MSAQGLVEVVVHGARKCRWGASYCTHGPTEAPRPLVRRSISGVGSIHAAAPVCTYDGIVMTTTHRRCLDRARANRATRAAAEREREHSEWPHQANAAAGRVADGVASQRDRDMVQLAQLADDCQAPVEPEPASYAAEVSRGLYETLMVADWQCHHPEDMDPNCPARVANGVPAPRMPAHRHRRAAVARHALAPQVRDMCPERAARLLEAVAAGAGELRKVGSSLYRVDLG